MSTLTVGTYNLYVNAVKQRPNQLLEDIQAMFEDKNLDVLVVQESGQAQAILRDVVRKLDLKVFDGFGKPGQDSTAIIYRPELKVKKFKALLLTRPTRVDPRAAGPTYTKTKWLLTILVKIGRRRVWVGCVHTTPSVQLPANYRVAKKQFDNTARWSRALFGLKIIGGDWNTLPDSPLRNTLVRAGLRSVQTVLGRVNTHESRNIDDIYFTADRTRIKPVRSKEYRGASDHDAFIVEFTITARKKRRLRGN